MPRREIGRLGADPERVGRRVGLGLRPRPDRHGAVFEIAPLPAERLRLAPRLEDQLHALVGALARFLRVQIVAEIFVGRAAQQAEHEASGTHRVEHRQLLGDPDRVADRHDRAQQRDLDRIDLARQKRRRKRRRRGQDARRIMVLGQADPVEAELLDKPGSLDHALKRLGAEFGVIGGRRHRPFARQVGRDRIAAGFEKRDLHRRILPAARYGRAEFRPTEAIIPGHRWRDGASPQALTSTIRGCTIFFPQAQRGRNLGADEFRTASGRSFVEAVGETALYGPVKRFLEARGYEVKGEVCGCDLVARRIDGRGRPRRRAAGHRGAEAALHARAAAPGHRPAGDQRARLRRGAAPAAQCARAFAGSAGDPPPLPPGRARADRRRPRQRCGYRGADAVSAARGAASHTPAPGRVRPARRRSRISADRAGVRSSPPTARTRCASSACSPRRVRRR